MNPNYRHKPYYVLIITTQYECIPKCMQKVRIIILVFLMVSGFIIKMWFFVHTTQKKKGVGAH